MFGKLWKYVKDGLVEALPVNWNSPKALDQLERLVEFKGVLVDLGPFPSALNSMDADFSFLVKFVNLISQFQDEGYIDLRGNATKQFNEIIQRFGRSKYGINQSKKGEKVTYDNIFLGGLYDLPMLSARQWLSNVEIYDEIQNEFQNMILTNNGKILKVEIIWKRYVIPIGVYRDRLLKLINKIIDNY